MYEKAKKNCRKNTDDVSNMSGQVLTGFDRFKRVLMKTKKNIRKNRDDVSNLS